MLARALVDVPAAFAMTRDCPGEGDLADTPDKAVFVPFWHSQTECPAPIERSAKRTTAPLCIANDGTYFHPMYMCIFPRKAINVRAAYISFWARASMRLALDFNQMDVTTLHGFISRDRAVPTDPR
jgi:hypothetical protein